MENKTNGDGIGFLGLLTILFIGLKLCGQVTWSWLWVLCPLWIIPAVFGSVALAYLIAAMIWGDE